MEALVTAGFALGFFALIMVSVALHELGHLLPAKAFSVRVPKYFVGFGPTIWSMTRGGTEYGLKWFPLGGYVRLLGMYPPRPETSTREGRLAGLADSAREVEWAEISPEDVASNRLFYQKRTGQKLLVMFGGPAMNLLIAFALMLGVTALHGIYRPQTTIAYVAQCWISDPARNECGPGDTVSPAAQAGMQAGDRVVRFNDMTITSYPQLSALVRANLDREARIVVERNQSLVPLRPVHTLIEELPDPLDPSRGVVAGWLGIRPQQALTKGGPIEVLTDMWTMTQQSLVALVQFPVKVWNVVVAMVSGAPRDVNGPISILGASTVAGQLAASDAASPADKVASFTLLLASVNLFLAVFNLIPLPPLDGGHIAGAIYEWLRRVFARMRGRPDPGFFDTAKLLPLAYLVGAVLLLSGLALVVADVISPLQIF